jgi:hypothetical protein
MRKVCLITSLLLLASILALPQANAANAKAGGACTKAGATSMVAGVKFTCVKSGRKLKWNKGVAFVKPTPTTTPSATPTPTRTKTPFVAPIPITLPVAQGAITFANILDNVGKIAQVAYENVQKTYAENTAPSGMTSTFWIGPNTVPIGTISDSDHVKKAMRLWQGFIQPPVFGAFFYSTQDEPLAELAYAEWRTKEKITTGDSPSSLRLSCYDFSSKGFPSNYDSITTLEDCESGAARIIDYSRAIGLMMFGIPIDPSTRLEPYRAGGLQIHEYTHLVQASQWKGVSNAYEDSLFAVNPPWIHEGLAHFAAKALASATFNDYLIQRNSEALHRTNGQGKTPPTKVSEIYDYLSLNTVGRYDTYYHWGYATGMLAVEALTAIGGVQSSMALNALEARGNNFSQAFELVYGIPWAKAQLILAQVISMDYLQSNINVK